MTTTSIDYDIDLSVLVGPMDEVACEHSGHDRFPQVHDRGPATHYIHATHECGRDIVYAACSRWVNIVREQLGEFSCSVCGKDAEASSMRVLGPVNG